MEVPYLKMHGTGNLILVVDQRDANLPPPDAEKLKVLGDDTTGPGFDQLMWVSAAKNASAIASYRVFNADGSEVEQCGNGVRCVASYLAGGTARDFTLQSPVGDIGARVAADGQVSVSMGAPSFEPSSVPFNAPQAADHYTIDVDGEDHEIQVVSMGNPHCVLRVGDVATAPVNTLGPKIEVHPRFPERTNVGFMSIRDRDRIDLRVHERGVGETLACGTGACAAVVTGQRLGLLDADVQVALPGGQLMISWRGGDEPAWLTGNAELISEGTIEL
ncbi:MAG: diaminopimelate epimerase [Pseudomonadota bacterium]